MNFKEWCTKWGVPKAAVDDLMQSVVAIEPRGCRVGNSEAAVQNHLRVTEANAGNLLFRNNVGAAQDDYGNHFRYGLANETKKQNEVLKSADLIGLRPVLIRQEHVGQTIGQFYSIEVKEAGWRYTGTQREQAQVNWANLINNNGGYAVIKSGEK